MQLSTATTATTAASAPSPSLHPIASPRIRSLQHAAIQIWGMLTQGYAAIFVQSRPWVGTFLFALSFWHVNAAISAVASIILLYMLATALHDQHSVGGPTGQTVYACNHVLIGLVLGQKFDVTLPITWLILLVSNALGYGLIRLLCSITATRGVALLSLPFLMVSGIWACVVASFPKLVTHHQTSALQFLGMEQASAWLPKGLMFFLNSLSDIVFSLSPWVGLIILCILGFKSLMTAFLAAFGFFVGCWFQSLWGGGDVYAAMASPRSFNYILVAIGLGGVFALPVLLNLVLMTLALLITSVWITFFNVMFPMFIPLYSLGFVVVVIMMQYLLNVTGYRYLNYTGADTPEKSLHQWLLTDQRFSKQIRTVSLPLAGKWVVWQGVDDIWTHQGIFRYALDFVKYSEDALNADPSSDIDGDSNHGMPLTYRGSGLSVEDYYAFNQPIYSPIWGRVILVVNHELDNPVGVPNEVNRWGNHMIIEDHRGFYVVLAHFKQFSIPILAGQWVEPGTYLGLCGNSGYSPQPHLHLHVQAGPNIGSITLPFEMNNYATQTGRYVEQGLPVREDIIQCVLPQPYYQQITTFLYDECMAFDQIQADGSFAEVTVDVEVKAVPHALGRWQLSDGGVIDFIKRGNTFYANRLVKKSPAAQALFCAYASLPQSYHHGMTWQDVLPIEALPSAWDRFRLQCMLWIAPARTKIWVNYRFVDAHHIEGEIEVPRLFGSAKLLHSALELDPYQRISAFSLEQQQFHRS